MYDVYQDNRGDYKTVDQLKVAMEIVMEAQLYVNNSILTILEELIE